MLICIHVGDPSQAQRRPRRYSTLNVPRSLVYARDYNGKTCGTSAPGFNCTDGTCKNIYYPRLTQDLIVAAKRGVTNPLDIPLTGVCMRACPRRGSVVCLYEAERTPTFQELRYACSTLKFEPSRGVHTSSM